MVQDIKTILTINGKPSLMIDPSQFAEIEDKTLNIDIPNEYVMINESLVGMGGLFTCPSRIGTRTCQDVIKSFRWFESQFPAFKYLSQTSSAVYLATSILSNRWLFGPLTLLTLPNLAFPLRTARKLSVKISEIKKYSHVIFALNPNEELNSPRNLPSILSRFHDFNSELAIAQQFAQYTNLEFNKGKGPDFYSDGIGIEVTRLRPKNIPWEKLKKKILDRTEVKFKQGAEIVAMDVTNTLLGVQMYGFTNPSKLNMHETILNALKHTKKGNRILITYTYKPNSMIPLGQIYNIY